VKDDPVRPPALLAPLIADTKAAGFPMASEALVGALLRTLAASKPGGRLLEVGTGTGLATVWLLDGMDEAAHLVSIEADGRWAAIAAKHLRRDPRLSLLVADAFSWFGGQPANSYDLVFADAMPGKLDGFEQLWRLLKPGGLYVIDDLLPQANWPEGHQPRVDALIAALDSRDDARAARMSWASGVVVATKIRAS